MNLEGKTKIQQKVGFNIPLVLLPLVSHTFRIVVLIQKLEFVILLSTTLQSMVKVKLSLHGFWHCHENGLIKTIPTIPHNLYVSFKSASLYCGLG